MNFEDLLEKYVDVRMQLKLLESRAVSWEKLATDLQRKLDEAEMRVEDAKAAAMVEATFGPDLKGPK